MIQIYSTYVCVPYILLSDSLDFLSRHSIHCVFDLLGSHAAIGGGGPIKAEQYASLELALGMLNLIRRNCRHTGSLLQREVCYVVKIHQGLRDQINTPKTGIRVGCGEQHEAVGEVGQGDGMGKTRR